MMRRVLSIFSSRKYIGRIVGIAIGIGVFVMGVRGLNYVYAHDDIWNRMVWEAFYNQQEIDNVYLGSSHVFCSVNSVILDELNGQNNFNLATGNQRLQQSYYNLLEADQIYNLKNVYLEMYYYLSTGEYGNYDSFEAEKDSWRDTDYRNKMNGVRYYAIFDMNSEEHLLEFLFPFIRYRSELFNTEFIMEGIAKKLQYNYSNCSEYAKKGYVSSQKKNGRMCCELSRKNRGRNAFDTRCKGLFRKNYSILQ